MNPGSIVRCRNRERVVLPSDHPDTCLLRSLTGATDEVVAVHHQLTELMSFTLGDERVRSATFPLPTSDDLADAASAELLWQAARLTLWERATLRVQNPPEPVFASDRDSSLGPTKPSQTS